MKQTLKRFNFYCDLSNDSMELLEVNNENIEKLFSNWDKENPNKHSLFTDLLLLSNK